MVWQVLEVEVELQDVVVHVQQRAPSRAPQQSPRLLVAPVGRPHNRSPIASRLRAHVPDRFGRDGREYRLRAQMDFLFEAV